MCWVYFCTLCPSIGPKERSRQALDRLPLVCNFLTNFWMQNFDGARLSPNSVRNAIWHALNEPVCQYLRTRNPRCSTVYIDNNLGPLARDSPCTHTHTHCIFHYFGTLTNKCTIISQIITLLHVSTLSCHPQTARNQYLVKLHSYFKCSCW